MAEAEMIVETCDDGDCPMFPRYPDEEGKTYCEDHHDGDFEHVPEPRRSELQEEYDG